MSEGKGKLEELEERIKKLEAEKVVVVPIPYPILPPVSLPPSPWVWPHQTYGPWIVWGDITTGNSQRQTGSAVC